MLQLALVITVGFIVSALLRTQTPIWDDVGDRPAAQSVRADRSSPTSGNLNADVTMFVFTDYRCPACRKAHPAMQQAVQDDGHVQVIYKDWPIFGPVSERAAKIALASNYQGIYPKVHNRLMSLPNFNDATLKDAVRQSGGDWKKLKADLRQHVADIDEQLSRNSQQAITLGLPGTPGYLVGPLLIRGAASRRQFRRAIAKAREMKVVG